MISALFSTREQHLQAGQAGYTYIYCKSNKEKFIIRMQKEPMQLIMNSSAPKSPFRRVLLLGLLAATLPARLSQSYSYANQESDEIAQHEIGVHRFEVFYDEDDKNVDMALTTIRDLWPEVLNIYAGSLAAELILLPRSPEDTFRACHGSALPTLCLRHTAPVSRDRSCILHPSLRRDKGEVPVTTYTGSLQSTVEIRDFIFSRLGFAIGHISNLNITTSDRFTVRGGIQACPAVPASELTPERFLREFFIPQRPVVVTGAFEAPTLKRVLDTLLRHGDAVVGAKLSPDDVFEGIEDVGRWQAAMTQHVPSYVLQQLVSPDKVVVRNAHVEMTIMEVLELIAVRENARAYNMSAVNVYVEYLDMLNSEKLESLFRSFLSDASELPAWSDFFYEVYTQANSVSAVNGAGARYGATGVSDVALVRPMLWLGDGHTVGKLHFDPFENTLYQLQGEKRFRLLDPELNERLYEGHMREAMLEAEARGGTKQFQFYRRRLLESTSMVHSPVDIHASHKTSSGANARYPLATDLSYMDCVVKEGEVLYVPSYWWHEVVSRPSAAHVDGVHLNLAVNFWFSPLFQKSFPCAACKKWVDSVKYERILRAAAAKGKL